MRSGYRESWLAYKSGCRRRSGAAAASQRAPYLMQAHGRARQHRHPRIQAHGLPKRGDHCGALLIQRF